MCGMAPPAPHTCTVGLGLLMPALKSVYKVDNFLRGTVICLLVFLCLTMERMFNLLIGISICLMAYSVQGTVFAPAMRLDVDTLPDLTDTCLGCICEATTNCNLTIGCMRGLCGPFLISQAYWIDAGRPVLLRDHPDRPGAYSSCVNDPYCAAETVRQYFFRFAQDCNKDRVLDCDDYARMHYLGGFQCSLPIDRYMYYHVFAECRRSAHRLNG